MTPTQQPPTAPVIDWSEYSPDAVDGQAITDSLKKHKAYAEANGLSLVPARVPDPPPADRATNDVPPARVSLRAHIEGVEAIADTIEGLDDETLSDADRDELSAMLIGAIAGTKAKVDSTSRVFAMFEGLEASAKLEKERLAKREAFYARQIQRLTDYVTATMTASGLDHLDGETSTLKLRRNPPSVVIEPGAKLSDEWLVYPDAPPPRPDRTAMARAMKAGFSIDGASLQATTRLVRS